MLVGAAIGLGVKLSKSKVVSKSAGKLAAGVKSLFDGSIAKKRKAAKTKAASKNASKVTEINKVAATNTTAVSSSLGGGGGRTATTTGNAFIDFVKQYALYIGLGVAAIIGFFLLRRK